MEWTWLSNRLSSIGASPHSLCYWAVLASSPRVCQSAIAFIITVVSTFVFFAKRSDQKTGLIAAFITLTSFELHRAGFNCRVDMVLTACTVCAIYPLCLVRARTERNAVARHPLHESRYTDQGSGGHHHSMPSKWHLHAGAKVNFWKLCSRSADHHLVQ